MGTAPPSKPVETPTRPFDRNERRVMLTTRKRKKTTTLFKLIARQDWQKVLIRISLFPNEVSKKQRMEWYGVKWNLLPLHLACALRPPPQVIEKLLEHHTDTAKFQMFRRIKPVANLEKGAFPTESHPQGDRKKKHRRNNFARLLSYKGSEDKSISLFVGDPKPGLSAQKPSPSKTLPTAQEEDSSFSLPLEKKKRRGKLAGLMSRGFKGKSARVLFPRESFLSEEPSYVKNASFLTTYSSLPEDTTTSRRAHDEFRLYPIADENHSWEFSAVGSSYSLEEGSPGLSLEDSLPDEYMDHPEEGAEGSINQFLQRQGAFLQLSLTGGLCIAKLPREIHVPREIPPPASQGSQESPELPSETAEPRQQRNSVGDQTTVLELDELLEKADELLPLHIACLYGASPEVLKQLLDAYPVGVQVLNPSFGMLPIHMVCAGLSLPPPMPSPKKSKTLESLGLNDDYGSTASALEKLLDRFPEGRLCPSHHNGMTPFQYVRATMDDGEEKKKCLEILSQSLHRYEEEHMLKGNYYPSSFQTSDAPSDEEDSDSTESSLTLDENLEPRTIDFVPSIIQYDDHSLPHSELCNNEYPLSTSDCAGTTPLYLHLAHHDWDLCLDVLYKDPEQARKWHYGVNVDSIDVLEESLLWKRLPLHDACANNAPPLLINALIASYPEALASPDPNSGFLPLHTACRCGTVGDETIISLLDAFPEACKTHDLRGCLPLHIACMTRTKLSVVKYLVASHPEGAWTRDCSGKLPVAYAKARHAVDREMCDKPEISEEVVKFLEALPSEVVAPKHRRDYANIVWDGSASMIRCSHSFPGRTHRTGKGFHSATEI